MTPQMTVVGVGAVSFALAKFYFQKETSYAITAGLVAIALYALVTVKEDKPV